jgi:hypothetical protein
MCQKNKISAKKVTEEVRDGRELQRDKGQRQYAFDERRYYSSNLMIAT